jgi:hypothetical protein
VAAIVGVFQQNVRFGGIQMLRRALRCSFCGRTASEVAKLVAGPFRILGGRVHICDRCAAQAVQIMEAHSSNDSYDEASR